MLVLLNILWKALFEAWKKLLTIFKLHFTQKSLLKINQRPQNQPYGPTHGL